MQSGLHLSPLRTRPRHRQAGIDWSGYGRASISGVHGCDLPAC